MLLCSYQRIFRQYQRILKFAWIFDDVVELVLAFGHAVGMKVTFLNSSYIFRNTELFADV